MNSVDKAALSLKEGKIGVIPTDTVYGIVGSALNPQTVEEIYRLRKRATDKPMIILIANLNDTNHFNIKLADKTTKILKKVWPNPVSVILPCPSKEFAYLHRGKKTIAFRMPKDKWLRDLLSKTGPLVAPSANIEGRPVAQTTVEAKKYFGKEVSFYLDGGKLRENPSTLIEIKNGKVRILRQGTFAL